MTKNNMQYIVGRLIKKVTNKIKRTKAETTTEFMGSVNYWETRYASGGTSGDGSYGKLALFKAEVINQFVKDNQINMIIDFGCGDGNQLKLANYPKYLGLDVSPTAISICKSLFTSDTSKEFKLIEEYDGEKADLTLSLDVIYHLIEDDVYFAYINTLFNASLRYVIIYSTDIDLKYENGSHGKHRAFSHYVKNNLSNWKLVRKIPQKYPSDRYVDWGSSADFFIYERTDN
jgi:hypothetical protein